MCDKHDRAITCVFCSADSLLTSMFSGPKKKICYKESEVWRKVVSNKIIVTLVTQGLPSSLLSRPVALLHYCIVESARKQILRSDWLIPHRTGNPALWGFFTLVPQEKSSLSGYIIIPLWKELIYSR